MILAIQASVWQMKYSMKPGHFESSLFVYPSTDWRAFMSSTDIYICHVSRVIKRVLSAHCSVNTYIINRTAYCKKTKWAFQLKANSFLLISISAEFQSSSN